MPIREIKFPFLLLKKKILFFKTIPIDSESDYEGTVMMEIYLLF